ncbi:MAG: RNA polymerase sigma-70 factor (ECF subfamily) [Myxococcota bacterium]|jgi:RNA polymerase sigma-70 factor (ECF subfamily)
MDVGEKGQRAARMREAVAQFQGPLFRYAKRLLGDADTANDVVQDTFLRLWDTDRIANEDHLRRWLYLTCRRRCIDVMRLRDRRPGRLPRETDRATTHGPAAHLAAREAAERFERGFSALSERQQEILRLKLVDGLSHKEVAAVTQMSVGNVGCQLHLAMQELKRLFPETQQAGQRSVS